jgi:3-hydroxyisobutyrate dehydrogenase-like beta-hydroxyacid dehydrogenase
MTTDRTLAFLGTGLMGAPIAGRLIKANYTVRVWNRSAEKVEPLKLQGATACATPAEAIKGCGIVCACLTDAAAVESVLFGKGGGVNAMEDGTLLIDFSTIGVEATRTLAQRLAATCRSEWLDCPVSGGVVGATEGGLIVFAGGSAEALRRAAPLLNQLAQRVTHVGRVGAGQATKLCNQLIVATNLVAIGEAITLAEKLGVDVRHLPSALAGGWADSKPLQIFGDRMAASEDPGPKVSHVGTMNKDIRAISAAAESVGLILRMLEAARDAYSDLMRRGLQGEDQPALMKLHREP